MMCFGLKDRKRVKTNHCVIVLLDDTQLVHELQPSSTGQDILDVVIKHLNLLETSYFGLRYIDPSGADSLNGSSSSKDYGTRRLDQIWLDVNRNAISQLKHVEPMTVYFGVKYYASDPCKLAEEITRYQFFLQCKQDILHSRLPVSFELAIELFGLAVQSELGDFDASIHHDGYVSEFQFLPNQSLDLERRVAAYHRKLSGQVPATAEINFLERVKWLDLYGCELHPIQYSDDERDEYALGINPVGVLVLRNRIKVAQYQWSRITKAKSQGRCFLMDVIDCPANDSNQSNGSYIEHQQQASASGSSKNQTLPRHRFGFRLIDKRCARRLLWSFENHKSFQHLIHNSATLNQLAQRQHMNFSQKFRNSIRSAINVVHNGQQQQQQQQQQQYNSLRHQQQHQQQQQQKLRSSMKNVGPMVGNSQQSVMQQQYALDCAIRPQPTVVRMPSRRYSNRSSSSSRPQIYQQSGEQMLGPTGANGNGLPAQPTFKFGQQQQQQHPHSGLSQTMIESQRQRALMMMNQLRDSSGGGGGGGGSHMIGKSQTLRPIPVSLRESKKNPYYQQMMGMMMAAAAAQQQQQHQHQHHRDIAILPPGRHLVQPTIYKASSQINGLDKLGGQQGGASFKAHNAGSNMMPIQTRPLPIPNNGAKSAAAAAAANFTGMQLFCGPPIPMSIHQRGCESPRSTKSAIATSSAMRLASKKLAQQQQYLSAQNGGHHDETSLLLAYDANNQAHLYSGPPGFVAADNGSYYPVAYNACASANVSPRSVRSARLSQHQRSKSTSENLHLLQSTKHTVGDKSYADANARANNLLLTTANSMGHPPPGYNGAVRSAADHQSNRLLLRQQQQPIGKRASIDRQQNSNHLLMGANGLISSPIDDHHQMGVVKPTNMRTDSKLQRISGCPKKLAKAFERCPTDEDECNDDGEDDEDDDYCCSRSDCSSIVERKDGKEIYCGRQQNGKLLGGTRSRKIQQQQQQQTDKTKLIDEQHEWNAIRKRHSEFSSGKGFFGHRQYNDYNNNNNNNNDDDTTNSNGSSQLLKNIPNKQATPILLSMNYVNNKHDDNNTKAMQLLNLQRQQLHQHNTTSGNKANPSLAVSPRLNSSSSSPQSASASASASSASSSPRSHCNDQLGSNGAPMNVQSALKSSLAKSAINKSLKLAEPSNSTCGSANSTTSGYYAGSNNSTGSASLDSDTQTTRMQTLSANNNNNNSYNSEQPPRDDSSRVAKVSISSLNKNTNINSSSSPANPSVISASRGGHLHQKDSSLANKTTIPQKDRYILDQQSVEHDNSDPIARQNSQWSPLDQQQQQQQPSSMKYVSFDV